MKNGPVHPGSFVQRWISRSSNGSIPSYGGSDVESNSTHTLSPPPLTDSSSSSASSSGVHTPKDSPVHIPRKRAPPRFAVVVKTPGTPPTRYAELPPVQTVRKAAISLPPNSHPSKALVIAQPLVKLHRLLSYHPMHFPLTYDISSPPSFIKQNPPQSISQRRQISSHSVSTTQSSPVPDQDLSQYATTPPVTHMHIVSDIIPWSIHVRGRQEVADNRKPYVRVVDVIEGIYHSLRFGVNRPEWDGTPKPFRDRVKKAYLERCARARAYTLVGYEEKQGVRRVDWFLEKTMFLGLTIMTSGQEGEGKRDEGDGDGDDERRWAMIVAPR